MPYVKMLQFKNGCDSYDTAKVKMRLISIFRLFCRLLAGVCSLFNAVKD